MAKANQWFRDGRYGNTFRKVNHVKIPIRDRVSNNIKWRQIK